MTPVIAVTARRKVEGGRDRLVLNNAYVDAVRRAGLVPLVIPSSLDPTEAPTVLRHVSGLLLTGGEDVGPERYRASPHAKLGETDPARDALELALVTAARERGLPLLGICRGIQILNVALGGTLFQDLPSERPGPIDHADMEQRHDVRLAPDSKLSAALGATTTSVNSRHHQAIRDLAPGLRAAAWAPDGLVEAVEGIDPPWTMAVQWHPEDDGDPTVFQRFAAAVG